MAEETHRCPDCGAEFETRSALVDHTLTEHVQAPTPAEGIRPIKHPTALRVLLAIGMVLGAAFWVAVALGGAGVFDSPSAPETPSSVVHQMAVELEAEGEIDDYRAIEPASGWDTEYELDDGDGFIRVKGEGTLAEQLEYEYYSFDGDTQEAIEAKARQKGFLIQD
jgi:hypothetical protein